jgi:hypothetical protein
MFSPDILYNEAPVSRAIKRLMFTPSPRIENGLIGVEKYPFFGMKYENDKPTCCACPTVLRSKPTIKTLLNF